METTNHNIYHLFEQLGLQSNDDAIAKFIHDHKLKNHEALDQAAFWSSSQSAFLRESWINDSDWVGVIDQLNSALHR